MEITAIHNHFNSNKDIFVLIHIFTQMLIFNNVNIKLHLIIKHTSYIIMSCRSLNVPVGKIQHI